MAVARVFEVTIRAPQVVASPTMSLATDLWVGRTLTTDTRTRFGSYDDQAWTNLAYSHTLGQVLVHNVFIGTGTDSKYVSTIYGNAVYQVNPRSNTLTLEKLVNWAANPSSAQAENTTEPTPRPRHVYGQFVEVASVEVHVANGANAAGIGHPNDHWAYHPTSRAWTMKQNSGQAGWAVQHEGAMTWAPGRGGGGRVIYYLGEVAQTWAYDPAGNAWTQLASGAAPDQRMGARMLYDPVRGRCLLFGGGTYPNGGNRMWSLSDAGSQWVDITTGTLPSSRRHMGFSYDVAADRILMAGGEATENGTAATDTWGWHPASLTWTPLTVTGSYGAPGQTTLVYHRAEDVHVLHAANSWYLIRPDWTAV